MGWRGRSPIVLTLALLAAGFAPAAHAGVDEWRALARDVAAPWPGIQRSSGQLPDYLNERYGSRYGDSFMGYALLQTGLRERDDALVTTGLRAVTFSTTNHSEGRSSFEAFAIAGAYNLARRKVPRHPHFMAKRARWEQFLRRARTTRLQTEGHYGNHYLIDALAVIELRRTGLRSRVPGAILGGGRAAAWRRARALINVRVPRMLGRSRAPILSDPPDQPVAYHGLSLGIYARAVHLLGGRASGSARRAVRRMVRGSQLLTAPDGDTAYWGRSQQYVWSPAGNAYGAESAAARRGTSAADRRTARALADRAFARIARDHPVGPRGQWIVPALAQDFGPAARALEGYAGGPSMSGIALAMLNWTIEESRGGHEAGRLPADRDLRATLSRGAARFAVVRHGDVWFAVKMAHARRSYLRDDLRYAFGLITAKRRSEGEWSDLVPQRPAMGGRAPVTAGPVLHGSGHPDGGRIAVDRRGRVTVGGVFRTRGGRVMRRATFTFTPADCGVAFSFRARRGDRYWIDLLFHRRPSVSGATVTDGEQRVTISPRPSSTSLAPRALASGRDAGLRRLRVGIALGGQRLVRVKYC